MQAVDKPDKDIVFVACVAGHTHVRPGQRKLRRRIVIERGPAPPGSWCGRACSLAGSRLRRGSDCSSRSNSPGGTKRRSWTAPRKRCSCGTRCMSRLRVRPVSGNFVAVLWLNVAPVHCVVVWQTEQSCGKPGRHVIRIRGVVEVRQVARNARRRQPREYVVFVALAARGRRTAPRQREFRRVVVELGAGPLRGRVAHCASPAGSPPPRGSDWLSC